MHCPNCHTDLLPKVYEHLSVSACNSCGGIWLTPPQLSEIVTLHDERFSPEEIQNTLKTAHPGLSATENTTALACPLCAQPMEEINYDYSSGVIINSCLKGDGLWFDKKELEAVQIYVEHWDDEENIHKNELLNKLKQVSEATEKEKRNEAAKDNQRLSKTNLLDRVFKLFDLLKMD